MRPTETRLRNGNKRASGLAAKRLPLAWASRLGGARRGQAHHPRRIAASSQGCQGRKASLPCRTRSPDQGGGTLRTVLDARAYMFRLSKDRERSARWQRVAQLLLAKADVGAVSRQLELALLYDGKLDVRAMA